MREAGRELLADAVIAVHFTMLRRRRTDRENGLPSIAATNGVGRFLLYGFETEIGREQSEDLSGRSWVKLRCRPTPHPSSTSVISESLADLSLGGVLLVGVSTL